MTLPQFSVSERLAAAFSSMPPTLPAGLVAMCEAVLTDVAGLCVAARNTTCRQRCGRAPNPVPAR